MRIEVDERLVGLLEAGLVRLTLDCSTSHLPRCEFESLEGGPLRATPHEHGMTIFLPGELPRFQEGWYDHPVLHRVVEHAIKLKCGFINFDQDGGEHQGLGRFEW